jgi:hypothetical protein
MSLRGAAELRRHLLRFLLWADPSKEVLRAVRMKERPRPLELPDENIHSGMRAG